MRLYFLLAVSVALLLPACGPPYIEGTVTDWATKGPLEGAEVTLQDGHCTIELFALIPYEKCTWKVLEIATTNAAGAFRFDDPPRHEHLGLGVRKPGYGEEFDGISLRTSGPTRRDFELVPLPPKRVEALAAHVVADGVKLTWTNPDDPRLGGVLLLAVAQVEPPGAARPENGVAYPPGSLVSGWTSVLDGSASEAVHHVDAEGTQYWYQAFSYSPVRVYAAGSVTASAKIDHTPPPPVTNLRAAAGSLWVTLTWTTPPGVAAVLIVRSPDALSAVPEAHHEYAPGDPLDNGVVVIGRKQVDVGSQRHNDSDAPKGHLHYAAFALDDAFNYAPPATTELDNL